MPGFKFDDPESPRVPRWLSVDGRKVFSELVRDLTAAKVPIKRADGHAVSIAAYCIVQAQEWAARERRARSNKMKIECSKQLTRYERDAQTWLSMICATPVSRARIGLRGATTSKKPEAGSVASILQQKADRAQKPN